MRLYAALQARLEEREPARVLVREASIRPERGRLGINDDGVEGWQLSRAATDQHRRLGSASGNSRTLRAGSVFTQ